MKLTYNKQTVQQQEIEIELPAFFESYSMFAMIKADGTVIKANKRMVFIDENDGSASHSRNLNDVLSEWKPSTQEKFQEALGEAIEAATAELPQLETV